MNPTGEQIKKREKLKLQRYSLRKQKAVQYKNLQQPQTAASVLTPKFVGSRS